ncbi:MAG: DeoR/GlpR transcriptional regulator [Anaerolineae bacterium]|nr:DeoR/GlpR transcriptional regulator [Anaerolineae bacterium]
MLAAERRRRIADIIRAQGSVRVPELCLQLDASESTIRRDLQYLERQGILERSYGGATAIGETARQARAPRTEEEARIGEATADLIVPGETVYIGPGTTPLAVAHAVARIPDLTVVTNALNVAAHLVEHAAYPVIVIGGQVERRDTSLHGHLAELALRELRADRAIIGVGGIHLPDGLTADALAGAQLLRAAIEMAARVTVVATADRWGHVGPAFLAPLEAIDTIVTSIDAPPAMVWDLTELGIHIVQT